MGKREICHSQMQSVFWLGCCVYEHFVVPMKSKYQILPHPPPKDTAMCPLQIQKTQGRFSDKGEIQRAHRSGGISGCPSPARLHLTPTYLILSETESDQMARGENG